MNLSFLRKRDSVPSVPAVAKSSSGENFSGTVRRIHWKIGAVILVLLAIILAGILVYLYFSGNLLRFMAFNRQAAVDVPVAEQTQQANQTTDSSSMNNPDATPETPVVTNDAPPTIIRCSDETSPLPSRSGLVKWENAQLLSDLRLVNDTGAWSDSVAYYNKASYFQVGTFIGGKYQGGTIILGDFVPDGPSIQDEFNIFVKFNEKYVELEKYSDYVDSNNSNFSADSNFTLSDLEFPLTLHSASPDANYTLDTADALFDCTGLKKAFTDPVVGDVYVKDPGTVSGSTGHSLFDRNGFYVEAPDGTTRAYQMVVPVIGSNHLALVNWDDNKQNTSEYSYQTVGGCGAKDYRNISNVRLENLQQEGVTLDGRPVYRYADPHITDLQDIFDGMYVPDDQQKISYNDYVASHPVFFWQDPYGYFVHIQTLSYQPMAECGKPVIYLYPQKKEKISVKIDPVGGMTKSDPLYNGGWNVVASPDGRIINSADNAQYPYLFWEGRGGLYDTPNKGFVVSQSGVHQLLEEKLSLFGLNEKERQDFEEFWEPRMQGSPYYFVTFMGNNVMDKIAPISISPKPDTVIRVLMDFKPLQNPITVQGYHISTPVRKGFTVVEWGGVLR